MHHLIWHLSNAINTNDSATEPLIASVAICRRRFDKFQIAQLKSRLLLIYAGLLLCHTSAFKL